MSNVLISFRSASFMSTTSHLWHRTTPFARSSGILRNFPSSAGFPRLFHSGLCGVIKHGGYQILAGYSMAFSRAKMVRSRQAPQQPPRFGVSPVGLGEAPRFRGALQLHGKFGYFRVLPYARRQ